MVKSKNIILGILYIYIICYLFWHNINLCCQHYINLYLLYFIPKNNIKIERIIVTLTLFNSQSRKSIGSLSCAGALVLIYKCYIFAKFIFKICNQFVVGIVNFNSKIG